MLKEKSLFYYGRMYHWLVDWMVARHRQQILPRVPAGASVLDIGCGTGELSLALRRTKGCPVTGVDLSRRQVAFASQRNPFEEVVFMQANATHLENFPDRYFDFGVMCQLLHELPTAVRPDIFAEMSRLCPNAILVDYNAPLPSNRMGTFIRFLEYTLGHDHYDHFKAFLKDGGVSGLLERAGLSDMIVESRAYNQSSSQVVVLRLADG